MMQCTEGGGLPRHSAGEEELIEEQPPMEGPALNPGVLNCFGEE